MDTLLHPVVNGFGLAAVDRRGNGEKVECIAHRHAQVPQVAVFKALEVLEGDVCLGKADAVLELFGLAKLFEHDLDARVYAWSVNQSVSQSRTLLRVVMFPFC